jgi:hypothetical protein
MSVQILANLCLRDVAKVKYRILINKLIIPNKKNLVLNKIQCPSPKLR